MFNLSKPKRVKVRAEWMHLHSRKDFAFWLAVAKRVKQRRVKHADLTTIRQICEEVNHEFRKR